MEYDEVYGWIYKYDRTKGVWRAFYSTDDTEVNQFIKDKLFDVMAKYVRKTEHNNSDEWDAVKYVTKVPVLTMEERTKFLFQET